MPKPSLDSIFNSTSKPSLDEIFGQTNGTVPGFENPMAISDTNVEQPKFDIKGVNAVVLETGRGFEKGVGQLIADAGWLANGGGLFKNGIGNSINQYGKDLMMNAQALPQTDLNGLVKGVANFVGSAAPMLATFAGGEILGAAKVGELAANAVGTLTNIRAAKYFSVASRAMGQGTLFGVVNAIDTASTIPESMDMKEQINSIMSSGKQGFIAGATLTPMLEIGTKVLSQWGEKAAKAYMIGITGSEKAAESALDLTRKPGTYQAIMKVNPETPLGQHIEFNTVDANKITNQQFSEQKELFKRQIDLTVNSKKEEFDIMKQKLTEDIDTSKQVFETNKREIDFKVATELKDLKLSKEQILNQNHEKLVNDATHNYQQNMVSNSQNLQRNTEAFNNTIQGSLDVINTAKEQSYQSVINTAPSDGFSVTGLMDKIKSMMQKEYGVKITKEIPLPGGLDVSRLSPDAIKQFREQGGSNRPSIWKTESRAAGGEVNPNALKVSKYLTDTLLPDLEEKIKTNNGVYTLDMLRETTKNIKAKGYEDGISNPGFASLDRVFRANANIGSLTDATDRGLFVGSDASYEALKSAAVLDNRFYNIKSGAEQYSKDIMPSVEAKAKVFGKDIETASVLSKLEADMELPINSSLRLSNNMKEYYDNANKILAEHNNISMGLKEIIEKQKNALNDEIDKLSFARKEAGYVQRSQERAGYIENKTNLLLTKKQELGRIDEVIEDYKKAIDKEKFDRMAALNEIRLTGRTDTPLGNLQRSFLRGAGMSAIFFKSAMFPLLTASALLTPKFGIGVARSISKMSQSSIGKAMNKGILTAGQSNLLRKLIIGNTLKR